MGRGSNSRPPGVSWIFLVVIRLVMIVLYHYYYSGFIIILSQVQSEFQWCEMLTSNSVDGIG